MTDQPLALRKELGQRDVASATIPDVLHGFAVDFLLFLCRVKISDTT
jgi:hypothetical protein